MTVEELHHVVFLMGHYRSLIDKRAAFKEEKEFGVCACHKARNYEIIISAGTIRDVLLAVLSGHILSVEQEIVELMGFDFLAELMAEERTENMTDDQLDELERRETARRELELISGADGGGPLSGEEIF